MIAVLARVRLGKGKLRDVMRRLMADEVAGRLDREEEEARSRPLDMADGEPHSNLTNRAWHP